MRKLFLSAILATSAFVAQPAHAVLTLGSTPCSVTNITPTAIACTGWYEGNLIDGPATADDEAAGINALLGTSYTGATLTSLETAAPISGNSINFATTLFGVTVIGFHVGAANGEPNNVGYSGTAFYKFDAGSTGLDVIGLNVPGLSNARLYSTSAIPEAATWMTMLVGFGALGCAMRRRSVAVNFA